MILKNLKGTRNLIKSFEGKTMEEVYDAAVSILVLLHGSYGWQRLKENYE